MNPVSAPSIPTRRPLISLPHPLPRWIRRLLARCLSENGIYYLGGAVSLPPPLSPQEEQEALVALSHGDAAAKALLIEHNLRLVVYLARKFENAGIDSEDLISIGTIGLIKAVETFRLDRQIKLATYASRCIENEILMVIRKLAPRRGEVSLEEPLHTDWEGGELHLADLLSSDADSVDQELESAEDRKTIAQALRTLPPRDREIISLRYGLSGKRPMTQKEVADLMGISQSYISRIEKKNMARLKKEIAAKV